MWLEDAQGQKFLDGISSWWVNLFGHNHPHIRQALVDMGEMFGLLGQPAEVVDKPDARTLQVTAGEVVLQGTGQELKNDPLVSKAYLGY